MALTPDILASYHAPRRVIRRQLERGQREDRALVFLMLACGLIFIAQWPRLAREAAIDPDIPFDARFGGALFGWGFLAPLFFYALAALSHVVARWAGGQGTWFGARLALFWSLLVSAPLWLTQGLLAGFAGASPVLDVTGLAFLAFFFFTWIVSLREAERHSGVEIQGEPS